jgi:hypothetical protein
VGLLAGLSGLVPVEASRPATGLGVGPATMNKIWAKKLRLHMEGETIDQVLWQVSQQLMFRVAVREELAHEPISIFAPECTLGCLRDLFADLLRFTLTPFDVGESIQFMLWEDAEAKRAALSNTPQPPAPASKPATRARTARRTVSSKPKARSRPPVAKPEAELLRPLVIPRELPPIQENDLFLPAIQQRLAKIAGIRIFSDYADRTEEALGNQSAEAFFRSLDGLPLQTALDRIAGKFGYTWRKSRGWYLFRSRTWKQDRKERLAEAQRESEEENAVDGFSARR